MGFLRHVSTVALPSRLRAQSSADAAAIAAYFGVGDITGLGTYEIPPELALTLSYVYCAVSTISDDFGTMTCQMFEDRGHDHRTRVSYSTPGVGALARKLRWQPNAWQTAKAFWSTLAWQFLLRPAAYAEIIYRPGVAGFVEQIIPRHPDRVRQEVLPSGRLRYRLTELGKTRYVTQDEMFVVRNTSSDGLNALSRVDYGRQALSSALALQTFTQNYFKKGATASLIGTYKGGQKEDPDEAALHASITRYMNGVENAGGLLLVNEDIDIKALGVEPEKAQLLGLKNLSGRDVARLFKMPPSWLGIEGAAAYASQVQDATNYVNRCQTPMVVEFEQAIQRDLVLAQDRYFAKFNMDYLLRGDLLARAQAYEILIRSRMMRPSEGRVREDWSPDEQLDRLSEGDFRPGTSSAAPASPANDPAKAETAAPRLSGRTHLKAMLALHDSATRVVRRERVAIEKLAKRHASDVEAWHAGLKEFYAEHAGFVAQTMRLSMSAARAYAAQHGALFERTGVAIIDGDKGTAWETSEADELAALALDDHQEAA